MNPPAFAAAVIVAARDAAKAHLRIGTDGEDALIGRLAASALALCEAFTGAALIARSWTEILPMCSAWQQLGTAPVLAIGPVEGLPIGGAAVALPADTYAIDLDADGEGWVRMTGVGPASGRVQVTFSAGRGEGWDDLPPAIAQGVVLMIAYLFETRERGDAPPAAITALWRPWRRLRLREAARA